jgi:hypothetical protein
MTTFQLKRDAEAMGISIESAIRMRIRYLTDLICSLPDYIEHGGVTPDMQLGEAVDEILMLKEYRSNHKKPAKPDAITDEQIQAAKDAPIESVVEFVRGNVACPFHDDKHPSAYHGTRVNRLCCPVCNKTWGAIDVLMQRDGYSFIDAVKQLS